MNVRREASLIIYSGGNFGKNLVWTAAEVSLLFIMTNMLALSPVVAGSILFLALIGDAALGIAVGAILARSSDRCLGSRLALVAAPVCGAAFAVLYSGPALSLPALAIVGALVFRAAYACLDVPHNILMMQVAQDGHARSRVASYRFLSATIGALLVAAVLLPALNKGSADGAARLMVWFGVGGGLAVAFTVAAAVATVGPRLGRVQAPIGRVSAVFPPKMAPLPALYAVALISGLTVPMFARVLLFDTTGVWSHGLAPEHMLAAITIGQFAGAVTLTWGASRYRRVSALAWSHAIVILVCLLVIGHVLLEVRLLPLPAMLLCCALGFGIAGVFSIPWVVLCATVDLVEHRSIERCEPQAFAYMLAALKVGAAIGTAFVAWSLWATGYTPAETTDPAVGRALLLGGFVIPLAGSVVCLILCRTLGFDPAVQDRILRDLPAR